MSAIKQFFALLKKETLYIVRDRKTLYTTVLMTVLLTPLLLWGISQLGQLNQENNESKVKRVEVVETARTNEFIQLLQNTLKDNYQYSFGTTANLESRLRDGQIDLFINVSQQGSFTTFTTFADPRSNVSGFAQTEVSTLYQQYSTDRASELLAQKDLTLQQIYDTRIQSEKIKIEGSANQLLTFFIPYLLILGLVQGGMQYAMETTSGEKERQTLATTLSLAASPAIIGLAKITSVLVWSLGLALLNVLSVVLTFRFVPGLGEAGIDLNGFGLDKIVQLLFIAVPLSFTISTGMVALGLFARNLKEGYSYATPLLIVSIFAAISSNFFDLNTPLYVYAIPLIGHIAAIKQIIFGSLTIQPFLLVTATTLLLFAILFWFTIRLFRKEEVLFRV